MENSAKITWCDKCGKYYNPDAEHGCVELLIQENRDLLQKFLGRYTFKDG